MQGKYGISIDQKNHIMKNIIQEYWGTKIKDEVKFQQSPFPIYIPPLKKHYSWLQLSLENN